MAQAQASPQAQQQQRMQMIYQATVAAIRNYKNNPAAFTDAHLKAMKSAADAFGIPFEVPFSAGRAFAKGAYELGEGLTLGLLPNSWDPGAMNTGESIAGVAGGLLGLAAPIGIGLKGASMGMRGLRLASEAKVAGRTSKLLNFALRVGAREDIPAGVRAAVMTAAQTGERAATNILTSPAAKRIADFALRHPAYTKLAIGGPLFLASRRLFEEAPPQDQLMEPGMEDQQQPQ